MNVLEPKMNVAPRLMMMRLPAVSSAGLTWISEPSLRGSATPAPHDADPLLANAESLCVRDCGQQRHARGEGDNRQARRHRGLALW